jgi:hypothetical protein
MLPAHNWLVTLQLALWLLLSLISVQSWEITVASTAIVNQVLAIALVSGARISCGVSGPLVASPLPTVI